MPIVDALIREFSNSVVNAAPRVVGALLIVVLGYLGIRVAIKLLDSVLRKTPDIGGDVYRGFIKTIARVFLWFGVILAALSALGLESIAASLGTATGFIALGVAYAVKDMLADAVAGVYLLRDEDFNEGDTVKIGGSLVGDVKEIELRKTRFTAENNDTVVKANAKIEGEWTRVNETEVEDDEEASSGEDSQNT